MAKVTAAVKAVRDKRIVDLLVANVAPDEVARMVGVDRSKVYSVFQGIGGRAGIQRRREASKGKPAERGGLLGILDSYRAPPVYDLEAELAAIERDMGLPPLDADLDALVKVMGLDIVA